MFTLEYKFSGNDLQKEVLHKAVDAVTKKVKEIRCPTHHQFAKVTATGSALSNLRFNVTGCCDELIEKVTKALSG